MAAAAGKKESVSLSLFTEVIKKLRKNYPPWPRMLGRKVYGWEKWRKEQLKAWRKQIFEVQTWKPVEGQAGAVMCETPDLGTKWPQWQHTLLFEGQVPVDMRVACPQDVKKMPLNQARLVSWNKSAAKHEREELKEGV